MQPLIAIRYKIWNSFSFTCTHLMRPHGMGLRWGGGLHFYLLEFYEGVYEALMLHLTGCRGFREIKICNVGTRDVTVGVRGSNGCASQSSPGPGTISPSYSHTFISFVGDLLQPRAALPRPTCTSSCHLQR